MWARAGLFAIRRRMQLAMERVRRCVAELGGEEIEVIDSPILGAEGNREFLLHARWS